MVLFASQIGEKVHPKKMHQHYDVDFPHGLIGQGEAHSHNVYKKDNYHLKIGKGFDIKRKEIEGYVGELHESKAKKKKEKYCHDFIKANCRKV